MINLFNDENLNQEAHNFYGKFTYELIEKRNKREKDKITQWLLDHNDTDGLNFLDQDDIDLRNQEKLEFIQHKTDNPILINQILESNEFLIENQRYVQEQSLGMISAIQQLMSSFEIEGLAIVKPANISDNLFNTLRLRFERIQQRNLRNT